MAKLSFTAGWAIRNMVRWKAASLGLQVQEFKGWLKSGFVVEGEDWAVQQMFEWVQAQPHTH